MSHVPGLVRIVHVAGSFGASPVPSQGESNLQPATRGILLLFFPYTEGIQLSMNELQGTMRSDHIPTSRYVRRYRNQTALMIDI